MSERLARWIALGAAGTVILGLLALGLLSEARAQELITERMVYHTYCAEQGHACHDSVLCQLLEPTIGPGGIAQASPLFSVIRYTTWAEAYYQTEIPELNRLRTVVSAPSSAPGASLNAIFMRATAVPMLPIDSAFCEALDNPPLAVVYAIEQLAQTLTTHDIHYHRARGGDVVLMLSEAGLTNY